MAVSQSLTLTQSSQNDAENYSRVRIRWTSTQTGESWNGYSRTAYYYVYLNGSSTYTRYSVTYTLPKGSTKTIVDTTITVPHKADGSGSIKVETWMDTNISAGVVEKSASLALDTIPRATVPTLSASSRDMGSTVTINLPRASSNFTHDLAYKFTGDTVYRNITTRVGTSYTWTVPDRASDIPNATSGTITIRCITKNGSTTVGTKTITMTARVPTSVVPTVSVSAQEAEADLADQFGAYIQSKSKLAVVITAAGAKGSTIKSYKTTLQGSTYTSASFTSAVLSTAGTLRMVTTVTDSRGRTAKKTTNVTVLAYSKPAIKTFTVYRCNSSGVAQDDGIYLAARIKYTLPSLNSGNVAGIVLEYKRSTASAYTLLMEDVTPLSVDTVNRPTSPTFSVDYSYDIRLTVSDYFGATAEATAKLPTAEVILDIKADGKGVAFGKTAERPGIDFDWAGDWDLVNAARSFGTLSGRYRTHDGLLLQWGSVTITPSAANTPTTAVVTFPLAYASTPITVATPVSSVPQNISVSTQRGSDIITDNTKAMAVTLVRNGVTATGVVWLAIGKAVEA